jgi:cellulose synthase/poly-beta-1,6-N-acetylglucosamine synthase-like glycosyltransferase
MLDLLLAPVAVIYLLVVSALFGFGIHFFYLTMLAWRKKSLRPQLPALTEWPLVTVQLPIYNELYVAQRLIDAAARLEYPPQRLQIQVLDDSTDETVQIIAQVVNYWRTQGVNIQHLHRQQRAGFKAGALAAGLESANGEFIAIFDADFLPGSDFLQRALPYFYIKAQQSDRPVAFVQTRWGHVNRDYSFLTFLQSLAIDAHFVIEQFARSQGGFWFNFNGTAGIWRRAAIEDAGGWQADTLTEDLDLSYRAFLRGWSAQYVREIVVPAELPVSFSAYRRQQQRWARGSLECAIKLLPKVWRAEIPFWRKIGAAIHMMGYGVHILLFALTLLYPLVLIISLRYPALISLFGVALIFNATAFAPTIFFVVAQQQLGRRWWSMLPAILFITALGAGMMLNTLRAALRVGQTRQGAFERTPKFGISTKAHPWTGLTYQLRLDKLVFFELLWATWNIITVGLALAQGNWVIAIYAALFTTGLLFTSGMTIIQTMAVRRSQAKQVVPVEGRAVR